MESSPNKGILIVCGGVRITLGWQGVGENTRALNLKLFPLPGSQKGASESYQRQSLFQHPVFLVT